jgi:hypothetical protein
MAALAAASYDAVWCSHNLEHYWRHDLPRVLAGFLHVLKDDGFAEVRVPDLKLVVRGGAAARDGRRRRPLPVPVGPITVNDVIYGHAAEIAATGQDFYAHKNGFHQALARRHAQARRLCRDLHGRRSLGGERARLQGPLTPEQRAAFRLPQPPGPAPHAHETGTPQESRARLFRRPRYVRDPQVAAGGYGCEVITFTADIGQGEELEPARKKAKKMGIRKIFIEDLREEFVRDFVYPMFRANAVYEGEYLLGTSIARPLIAKALIDTARKVGADAIAHGATGKGNDQVRFELGAYALMPEVRIIAPWREWNLTGASRCSRTPTSTASRSTSRSEGRRRAVLDGRQPAAHLLRVRHPRGPGLRAGGVDVAHHGLARRRRPASPSTSSSTTSAATSSR